MVIGDAIQLRVDGCEKRGTGVGCRAQIWPRSTTQHMNALRNKVQLIGRLGKDAEMITFDDGKVKARFPVATNESFRNGEGERVERTQWHDVVAWGGLAEVAGQYLKKGAEVAVEGRLTYRTYEDGEGHTRYITEVVAGEMLMLEKRPDAS